MSHTPSYSALAVADVSEGCFDPSFVEVKQTIPNFYGRRVDDKRWNGVLLKYSGRRLMRMPHEVSRDYYQTEEGGWWYLEGHRPSVGDSSVRISEDATR